jgi:hypothetical protein
MLHPTVDRGVIDVQAPLEHHLLKIPVAERIAKILAYAEQNNLRLEVTPFERAGGVHEIGSSHSLGYCRVYRILAIFATQPVDGAAASWYSAHSVVESILSLS